MDKTIVTIGSHLEMLGFLKTNGTQCRFVSIVTETPVKNIRAGCPYKGVIKTARKTGLINVNYVASVGRRIAEKLGLPEKTVEYKPGEVWYEHLTTADNPPKPLPVVVNKTKNDGEYYLQYFPRSSVNVYQMPNGDTVPETELEPWFYKREVSEYKPTVISIKLSNIKRLAASGVIMQAEDLDEAEAALATVS